MNMKKLTFTILLISLAVTTLFGQADKLEVGLKAPEWIFTDANKKEFTMDSWAGKVMQINYVDPDEQNLNEAYNEAIDKAVKVDKTIDSVYFKGIGIVDTKSTWKPNGLIRMIAGNKSKKYKTTILFDYKGTLHDIWGMPKDSYSVVIVDKNRICRAIYKGKISESENDKIIQSIIAMTKE